MSKRLAPLRCSDSHGFSVLVKGVNESPFKFGWQLKEDNRLA